MITFEKVSKTYRRSGRPALNDVSVNIDKGEFVFLIGPSGSGKSTFLELMIREEVADSGTISVADYQVNTLKPRDVPKLRQRIGYVFQDFRLLPKKNVFDNVAFAMQVIGKDKEETATAVSRALELVGLSGKENRLPNELSGGEQQRVAIARAVVNRPLVLLADEPTGNLDPDTSTELMGLLSRINRDGTTVVMSTHDNTAVDSMRRRVLELSKGKLVRDDAHGVYGVGR
ncbi:cell division ATP-binding protein FtsE [Corynebacterium variabile]|uniref:cell division ATP-binding protein FtsE n=1 Tax=Corynebacterium variabile TaxID=1727 RepID=UPI002649E986|nr:cell division ATP-binding protein FtsE [Corynebacterium variabile]MDN6240470.1 cell division ATP-binding protein FtsE [Corynebacterium variabile]MDN6476723.1 cell division ATP-binding protein FtsE [Corynebacterium variabile]MDN6619194.1 cell division ATP-binding protein FtsE [Corynebacterium variabile]MDN6661651.1 cell division ATP-binding protein FtsE [Corynebacterium variabile]MDN6812976.1 cell division ATP-binding protein FtsE [Corynebacterium variabile]